MTGFSDANDAQGRHDAVDIGQGGPELDHDITKTSTSDISMHIAAATADSMRALGRSTARLVRGGDVILLSGPLGAGKTTFAQGFGIGLGIAAPIVSPTFTIARELNGSFHDGSPAKLIHVDAYRLGDTAYMPGEDVSSRLLDELESLGLDEELENPGSDSVVLMEWGEQMAVALAPQRLAIAIERPVASASSEGTEELTSEGLRNVTITGVGSGWAERVKQLEAEV
jgi:tRNA threonylcarbamoyladenosine biosynthesis protein TsaE